MKLLIADGNRTSRTILSAITGRWGFDPIAVEDGYRAWQVMHQENPPHLLLLDWELPKLDGLDLCQRLRQRECENPPYIIMLT
ncbi:MAG: response regulator, partial [Gammaproteobacteria bacterium]|nr:response regulator [Gammaproteobacteria bacterium]